MSDILQQLSDTAELITQGNLQQALDTLQRIENELV